MALKQVLLTMLSSESMTGYEITKKFDYGLTNVWYASHQQVYKELAKLSSEGFIEYEEITQTDKPSKKNYSLSKSGLLELQNWIVQKTPKMKAKDDLLVKLLAGHVVEPEILLEEFVSQRTELEVIYKEVKIVEKVCMLERDRLSEYEQALHLSLRWGLYHLSARLKWIKEVEGFIEGKLSKA